MHMHPRSERFDALLLYAFTIPIVVISIILVVMSIISVVLWAVGTFQLPG